MELKTENLVKCYGKKAAVRNVSLTLSEGIYGLLGENGAGKTTLMGLLCGIQQPTHGKITLNGRTIEALGADYRKMLGYLPQNFGYYPEFKVWDFLLYVAALKGLSRAKAEEKSGEMLKEYMGIALLCLLGAMGGVLLETYVNPFFLSWMAGKM